MNLLLPTSRDIADTSLAIKAIPGAWGSVDAFGEYSPSLDERQLWLMVNVTCDKMTELWKLSEISTGLGSSFSTMHEANNHVINVRAYKAKTGLFSSAWFGNVFLIFGANELYVGATGGKYQSEMWAHVQDFLKLRHKLHNSPEQALKNI